MIEILAQLAANPESGVTNSPHWGWYVILYFFLGGLAAGLYFIATLLQLVGDPRDRPAIQLGYLLAFPLVIICGVILIVDLGQPQRFWHMLIQSHRFPLPMFKGWSPISVGSWVLSIFGFFAFISFVGVMIETGRLRRPLLVRLDRWARERPRPIAVLWGIIGAFFGFFLAGYTGVLLIGTSVPLWHNAHLLGGLFLISAASTSYALLMLLLMRRGETHTHVTVRKLERADRMAIIFELILLGVMLVLLGSVARPLITGGFGVVFWGGVVIVGLIVPLIVHRIRREGLTPERRAMIAAACVLIGGLLLRFVVIMSPQYPETPLWYF
ncbi:MAG TPA: NrfD/PsrC family molybdoenzyme membrane anchor subunit [Gemmatimonadaceae bacterium]|nr:NrfD/PsrC family molybdoenzyme membrane anchor subunit [Gemmatimonadaceae bacterium]